MFQCHSVKRRDFISVFLLSSLVASQAEVSLVFDSSFVERFASNTTLVHQATSVRGQDQNGLVLSLKALKPSIRIGEPMLFVLLLQNYGSEPVNFVSSSVYQEFKLGLLDGNRQVVEMSSLGKRYVTQTYFRLKKATLEPQSLHAYAIHLNDLYDLEQPGRYFLYCTRFVASDTQTPIQLASNTEMFELTVLDGVQDSDGENASAHPEGTERPTHLDAAMPPGNAPGIDKTREPSANLRKASPSSAEQGTDFAGVAQTVSSDKPAGAEAVSAREADQSSEARNTFWVFGFLVASLGGVLWLMRHR
jgi:hypothetical protein